MEIYLDGVRVSIVDTNGRPRELNYLFYKIPTLVYGEHTIKVERPIAQDRESYAIGINGFNYLDNFGRGLFEIINKT